MRSPRSVVRALLATTSRAWSIDTRSSESNVDRAAAASRAGFQSATGTVWRGLAWHAKRRSNTDAGIGGANRKP